MVEREGGSNGSLLNSQHAEQAFCSLSSQGKFKPLVFLLVILRKILTEFLFHAQYSTEYFSELKMIRSCHRCEQKYYVGEG